MKGKFVFRKVNSSMGGRDAHAWAHWYRPLKPCHMFYVLSLRASLWRMSEASTCFVTCGTVGQL